MRILWRLLLALVLLAALVVGGPWLLVQFLTLGRTWTSADEAPARDVVLVIAAATRNGLPATGAARDSARPERFTSPCSASMAAPCRKAI